MRAKIAPLLLILCLLLCSCAAPAEAPASKVPISVSFSLQSQTGTPAARERTLSLPGDATVYSALLAFCGEEDLAVETTGSAALGNLYVVSIGGVAEKTAGSGSGWVYTVNDETIWLSAARAPLKDGDAVSWTFLAQ